MKPVLPRQLPGACLRRLRATDLADFQAYRALPELGRYQGWTAMTEAEAKGFLARMSEAHLFAPGAWVQLGIAEPASDRLVGDIGLHLSADGRRGEVGFTLEPSSQGKGIASCAVREALHLFFSITRAAEVRGVTDARNAASIRLLERLGFTCIEVCEVEFRGEACTERVYVLPRGE